MNHAHFKVLKRYKRREIISLSRTIERVAQRFAYLTLLRFFATIRLPPECVTHCHAFPLDKNAALKTGGSIERF
ncbi:hypothetical protein, partial [Pseudomonas savastanoi]